jgi:hypothetical protein
MASTSKSPFVYNNHPQLQNPPSYSETFLPDSRSLSPATNFSSSSSDSTTTKSSPRPHPLDSTPPNLLLSQILSPLFILSKWIGIFPLEIDRDGVASFGLRKFSMILYFVWLVVFIGLSAYYSRMYKKIKLIKSISVITTFFLFLVQLSIFN